MLCDLDHEGTGFPMHARVIDLEHSLPMGFKVTEEFLSHDERRAKLWGENFEAFGGDDIVTAQLDLYCVGLMVQELGGRGKGDEGFDPVARMLVYFGCSTAEEAHKMWAER